MKMKQLFRFRIAQALILPFDHIYSFHRITFCTEKRLKVIAFLILTSLFTGSHLSIAYIDKTYAKFCIGCLIVIRLFNSCIFIK